MKPSSPKRIRDYGLIPGQLKAGPRNLITDVPGVTVGHMTRTGPDGSRTGISVINPSTKNVFRNPLPAGVAVGNGFGKSTGLSQIAEFGTLETPIALTTTLAVGPVLQGLVDLVVAQTPDIKPYESINAIVGETLDWILNRIHTNILKPEDVTVAWKNLSKDFDLGAVGAGTGTRAFSWKGGIGSSSRLVALQGATYHVGTLVQTNFGGSLTILGVPVGRLINEPDSYTYAGPGSDGSCMIITATDAPLSSRQLNRLAKRSLIGMARTGSVMASSSGDFSFAFSTVPAASHHARISDGDLNDFFIAAAEVTEESVYDALFTAITTTGRDGQTLQALPVQRVVAEIKRHLG